MQNMQDVQNSTTGSRRWLGYTIRILLTALILAIGGLVSYYWITHRPTAQRRSPQAQARLVEAIGVESATHKVVIQAMGTVTPARSIQLASRVAGRVVDVSPNFVPGGRFSAKQRILQIDPRDYQIAIKQRSSDLAKAQCDLQLEMGQQSVAQREYELLGEDVAEEDMELLLRGPQLQIAKATVDAARASLEKAELDLARTDVLSPFNAIVQSRNVDLGSEVSVGSALASLIDTDKYWVRVSIPVDKLKWISIPGRDSGPASSGRVYHESAWGADVFRLGIVERLMTDLEPQGRMARLLIAVSDPLESKPDSATGHPLILESYVRVEIQGRDIPDVFRIPRSALRDGNYVWLIQPDNTLDIRQIEIIWSTTDSVYVSEGLVEGDALITSDLAAPVRGMALRTASEQGEPQQ